MAKMRRRKAAATGTPRPSLLHRELRSRQARIEVLLLLTGNRPRIVRQRKDNVQVAFGGHSSTAGIRGVNVRSRPHFNARRVCSQSAYVFKMSKRFSASSCATTSTRSAALALFIRFASRP